MSAAVEFQIWTRSNQPMMAFDSEARAELARVRSRQITGAKLVRVTRVVEELAA